MGLGRRIVVYGPTGSGKTTVSRAIGERLGLPVVELDALLWRPQWQAAPFEEFKTEALELLSGSMGWVCDGNYASLRPYVLPMADTVIWLRLPFRLVYWQLLRRTAGRATRSEVMWGTNRETWGRALLSKDSILLFGITNWRKHFAGVAESLRELSHHAQVIELRSRREVREFLQSLVQSVMLSEAKHPSSGP